MTKLKVKRSVTIKVDWTDPDSISRAEKARKRLYDKGFSLYTCDTSPFTNVTYFYYMLT